MKKSFYVTLFIFLLLLSCTPQKSGKKVEIKRTLISIDGDTLYTTGNYKYNSRGKTVERQRYDGQGQLLYKTIYTYQKKKSLAKKRFTSSGDVRWQSSNYHYFPSGKVKEITRNYPTGEKQKEVYSFNSNGSLKTWSLYDEEEALVRQWTNVKHTQRGKKLSAEVVDGDGRTVGTIFFEYGER